MARPKNETEDDLKAEEEARKAVEEGFKCQIQKLQPHVYSGLDWVLYRHNKTLHSWGEFKRRYVNKDKYPTLMISLGKWLHLKWTAERSMLPFAIYVQWDDTGVQYKSWPHTSGMGYTVGMGARGDRDQPGDLEPCIFIPVGEFRPIKALTQEQ